jgi:hypothetical protein
MAVEDDAAESRPKERETMPDYAFAVPIVPGQEQHYRETFEELEGARRNEYEAALAEAGVRRLATWLLEGPEGTLAVVYIDADDETGGIRFASADAPFNSWFRERMKVAYGFDISQTGPDPKRVHDSAL